MRNVGRAPLDNELHVRDIRDDIRGAPRSISCAVGGHLLRRFFAASIPAR
jgi:hypothetical protein